VTHGASKGGVAPASSEFVRVLPGSGYLVSFREVRFSAGLKRKMFWPEVRAEVHFCWFAGVGRRATRPSQIEEEGGLHNGFQVYDYAVNQDLALS